MIFKISKGTNISHWLSQNDLAEGLDIRFTESDIIRIKKYGFDHIRLPVDEMLLFDENRKIIDERFSFLTNALDNCKKYKLKIILDVHRIRGHSFENKTNPSLFQNPEELEKFQKLWEKISERLKHYSNSFLAYEILNEPVAQNSEDWNRVFLQIYKTLRKLEPKRVIVIGSNKWNMPFTFNQLKIPESDSNIILTFHFYLPFLLTHYQATWTNIANYKGPIHYPGMPIAKEDFDILDEDTKSKVAFHNHWCSKEQNEKDLSQVLAAREKTKLQIYCGEFGCYKTAPKDLRIKWYKDVISIFNKLKISYANWDYKGGFGIVNYKDNSEDKELIKILIKNK
jgi:endoglucanase